MPPKADDCIALMEITTTGPGQTVRVMDSWGKPTHEFKAPVGDLVLLIGNDQGYIEVWEGHPKGDYSNFLFGVPPIARS